MARKFKLFSCKYIFTINFRAKINLKMTKHFWRENSNYFLKIKSLWIFAPKIFLKSKAWLPRRFAPRFLRFSVIFIHCEPQGPFGNESSKMPKGTVGKVFWKAKLIYLPPALASQCVKITQKVSFYNIVFIFSCLFTKMIAISAVCLHF